MNIRKQPAVRGWIWIKQGYQLIMRKPLMSVTLAIMGAMVLFAALIVPQLGPLIAIILMPVVMAGYMRICRALEYDDEIELTHLFEGFQKRAPQLLSLGGLALLGLIVTSIVMIFIGNDELAALMESVKTSNDPQLLIDAMLTAGSGVAFSLMVGFVLLLVLVFAMQYAPMLVFFDNLPPFSAIRASLTGSLRNVVPYSVYNLIIQVIALALSQIPFNIGMVVLLPLSLTSLYVSYRNIFPAENEVDRPPPQSVIDSGGDQTQI